MKLNQAVALITGGAQGLGRTFSKKLLEQGTKVIVADLNKDAGEKFESDYCSKYGEKSVTFLPCDVTNSNQLRETFEEAKKRFGRLDIVCNNAGIMTTDPTKAKLQVDVNLTAVIEGTYNGIDLMSKKNKDGRGGVIVNVASAAGLDLMIDAAVFSATKHGVVAFTRSFKRLTNFKDDDVRVNCIAPFFCETAMVAKAIEENPAKEKVIKKIGMVNIADVGDGFMRSVVDEKLNAGVIVIAPNNKIYEMNFGMAKV